MAMSSVRRKEILSAQKGEPELRIMHYKPDLIRALNYYNSEHNDKDKKKWFISHIAKTDKKMAVAMLKLDESLFRYAGILARLVYNKNILEEKESLYLFRKIDELKELIEIKDEPVSEQKNVINLPSIQDRIEESARKHAAEFDSAMDDYVLFRTSDFSAKTYLLSKNISAPVAKRIGELIEPHTIELKEAQLGECEQLTEGYSYLTKKELKKFIEYIEGMVTDCNQQVQTAKANRSPRKRKERPPSVQTAKVKYLKEFVELGLTSVQPATIIGSTEVWYYNTKYKLLGVYKGANGDTLAVKGTTLIGFDIKDSMRMKLRKPEAFFKGLSLGKRARDMMEQFSAMYM